MAHSLVHVVDDDPAMRDSVGFLLDTAGFEIALYEAATDLLDTLVKPARGCVLTDIRMPGVDGLELLRRLRACGHTLPVVVMTGHGDVQLAVEAMKLGACDFIEKPFDDEALVQALRSALNRGGAAKVVDPTLDEFVRRVGTLSDRERQVMDQLVAGGSSKDIGRTLDISPRTVEIYRAKLMAKTQAASLQELVRWSVLAGLA
ncbi:MULTISPECIES: response regulator FixJ [unclassified Methylobacterium]|jgi:two-component system response regulator FixJ|uniref:response regulator FixJ n=1 Tax=unclassified Methylobacterium TaxID=2615210 RepID=UPI0006FBCED7|nr:MULTISPECIES: response regulator FixJ [unclassified Methylobacterium]KQO78272.1 two-component system response regulator [Methylobacterium sp. Leaf88]KQP67966.1 two-component system response regulator [Methylobacterium sp. Leaf111]KQT70377.1 two-component system response regulator [Methylobacterium sp. Leaf465]KQU19021.1 two-component system response regulator [Methylobacterium sp. Leaf94]